MAESACTRTFVPADARLVDQLCDEFEDAWPAGDIDAYLAQAPERLRPALFGELLAVARELSDGAFDEAGCCAQRPDLAAAREHGAGLRHEPRRAQAGDRYERRQIVGSGGLGAVWLTHDRVLDRAVALKELLPRRETSSSQRRFLHEAQITAQLEHPNIVPVYDLVPSDAEGRAFYTMRLIAGQTLQAALQAMHAQAVRGQPNRLEQRRLLEALVQAAQAVAYAHSRGVLHRDLKPENVVLGPFGEVLVLDWGLAKRIAPAPAGLQQGRATRDGAADLTVGEEQPELSNATHPSAADTPHDATAAGVVLGTPAYMAPEQAAGAVEQIDQRTDVFGLGGILYAILCGRPPVTGESTADVLVKAARGERESPRSIAPSTPAALEAICLRAMARNQRARYASAGELVDDLRRYLADEAVEACPEGPMQRFGRFLWRHRTAAAIGLLSFITLASCILAGVSLAAAYFVNQERTIALMAEAQAVEHRQQTQIAAEMAQMAERRAVELQRLAEEARKSAEVSAREAAKSRQLAEQERANFRTENDQLRVAHEQLQVELRKAQDQLKKAEEELRRLKPAKP